MNIARVTRRLALAAACVVACQAQAAVVGLGSIGDNWFDPELAAADITADTGTAGRWTRWRAGAHDLADVPPLVPDVIDQAEALSGIDLNLADGLGFRTGRRGIGDGLHFGRGHHGTPPRPGLTVPEPGSLALVACSLALLGLARRRRR